jgi:hypothetical protein
VEQLRTQLFNLQRQQALDRAHFDATSKSHADQLEDLQRRTLESHRQEQSLMEAPSVESESIDSSLKSENDDMELDLYDA